MVDEYDKIPAVRRSLLWELKKSPAHFKWAAEGEGIEEETPAMRLGTIIHMCVLELSKYLDHYRVLPNVDRRTKEGKARCQEVLDKLEPGQEAITWEENDQAMQMHHAVMYDPYASKFFYQYRPEQVYVWTDPETGERCKIKADLVVAIDGQDYIVDFKTTDSCQDGHFERSVKKYGYQLIPFLESYAERGVTVLCPMLFQRHYLGGIRVSGPNGEQGVYDAMGDRSEFTSHFLTPAQETEVAGRVKWYKLEK